MPEFDCLSRRGLLRTAAVLAGVTVLPGVITACAPEPTPTAQGGKIPAADIPVGAAVVVAAAGKRLLVAQPTAGEYVAYSANCPHEGALIKGSDSTVVRCPAHGSEFDTADGGVPLHGPAASPLLPVTVTVEGDQLALGAVPSAPPRTG